MSVTPEELAAYADGQLEGAELARVEAAIAADPALAAEVAAHRQLKARLAAHFAPILDEPVPERLGALLSGNGGGAEVVDFAAAAQRRDARRAPPQRGWLRYVGPALAASLVLGLFIAQPGGAPGGAGAELAAALDSQPAGAAPGPDGVRVVMTFARADGTLCRGFAAPGGSGVACRAGAGWKLERSLPGASAQNTDYRQAASEDGELMAAIQDLAAAPPLDPAAERAAMARGWRAARN